VKKLNAVMVLALFLSTIFALSAMRSDAAPQHGFSVKQYETFHDVLHPLEHEALPKGDYKSIRTKAGLLYSRGRAIVRLGVPAGTSEEQKAEFVKGLKTFSQALTKFRSDARRGTNEQLKVSYSAVHDSFEMLAGMLPRQHNPGVPPTISLSCPSSRLEEGEEVTLSADYPHDLVKITWTLSAGRILEGQHTRTIKVDTVGLAGKTIKATAECDDGFGSLVATSCEVQVTARQAKS